LTRLSARSIVSLRRGSPRATADTAVASVGATTAPSTHATGQLSPSACPTTATAPAVTITNTTDESTIGRRFARISRSDVFSASVYNNAGRNSSSTTSGANRMSASHGMNASGTPPSSSTIGATTPSRRASHEKQSTARPIGTSTCNTCASCTQPPRAVSGRHRRSASVRRTTHQRQTRTVAIEHLDTGHVVGELGVTERGSHHTSLIRSGQRRPS
jgi:hypothetical protein